MRGCLDTLGRLLYNFVNISTRIGLRPHFARGGGVGSDYLCSRPIHSLTDHGTGSPPTSTLQSPHHDMEMEGGVPFKSGSSTTQHAADFALPSQLLTKLVTANVGGPTHSPEDCGNPPTSTSQSLHVMEIERRRPSKSGSSTTFPVHTCKPIIEQCDGM